MIAKILEVFTEYIGIILCIHKVAGKKIKINWKMLLDLICYMVIAFSVESISFGKLIMFAYWFVYIKIGVANVWKQAIKSFTITVCIIPMIQLLIYAAIGEEMLKIFNIFGNYKYKYINYNIFCSMERKIFSFFDEYCY